MIVIPEEIRPGFLSGVSVHVELFWRVVASTDSSLARRVYSRDLNIVGPPECGRKRQPADGGTACTYDPLAISASRPLSSHLARTLMHNNNISRLGRFDR